MKKIYQRKPKDNAGLYRPQEPGYLHDDPRIERTTRPMDEVPHPIQLQNHIPTMERRRETRRAHKPGRRSTNSRRQKSHEEYDNTTTTGKLGHPRSQRNQS